MDSSSLSTDPFEPIEGDTDQAQSLRTEQIDRSKLLYFNLIKTFNRTCEQLKEKNEVDCHPMLKMNTNLR